MSGARHPAGTHRARDPGAQPERTRLAWRRTTLSFALVIVLAGRGLVVGEARGRAVGGVAVALMALLWVGVLALAHRRLRALTSPRPAAPDAATVLGAAGAVVVTALLAVVLVAVRG
ncbi:DUF202 domain-containing protein [Streptomyces radicis]|uniref:DUF202 domain-containing protein n=1 Tax=Streptomyces radicis TaxID=1750517 RepID=A0A3A9VWN6_9ACTN|nr:DUF202 domain-containing protein [Streptomyces radicis]RKN05411.1 DUF202 domain-containing protein [Streptomyces radicis]RKN16918.1 DUF202 domain-containing protein [Streptomyces radicis]